MYDADKATVSVQVRLIVSHSRLVSPEKLLGGVQPVIPPNLYLTGDTRKIFVLKTVDESHSARVLTGCKPII